MQGLNCRRDLELGCSHISGLLVGRQMKPWALMDFRALRSAISLAASRAMVGDRVGKCRCDRFTISVTQRTLRNLGKSGFSATSVLDHTHFAPCARLTAGGEPGRKTADVILLAER